MLTCARCGTANDPAAKFCIECGNRMAAACPTCGTANPAGAKFCGQCGTSLGTEQPPAPDAATGAAGPGAIGEPVAERRLVSVMFVDLVGFTTVSEGRDADDMRELLGSYYETAREIVGRHGGVVEKFIGDAVMAVWGTPTAHEDDAERAVRAALQLVAAVGSMQIGDDHLQARGGILTGEAAVTIGATNQGMVAGDLVNTASRIQSVAQPGTVLVGEATMRAATRAIAFDEAGERELKGKAAPVPVWRATAVVARRGGSGRTSQLEPPFVGRDEELRALKEQFHATAREGKPRLATVIGQAGIGKSRLGWELEKYLDGVVENIWFHGARSPSYGEGISYWALAEMVRGRAGIAETDDPEPARERLHATVEEVVADPTERRWIEPRLAGLIGLDEMPEESREELFAAWRTFFERMAEGGTVLLAFWDLQWADQGLLDFVEHLLTWSRSSPIFVLAEARPELLERRPGWGRSVRASATIHLEPLSADDMRLLLTGLVPEMPSGALQAIVERAEGVPLYAVETLRMLVDGGSLRADEGRYVLVGELPELAVPETLHALIAARLDRLDADERSLITDASVLGLSFTTEALVAVSGLEASTLEERVAALVGHELLVMDVDPRSPERGQHRFVQGVVREVAYQSLAKRDRRAKHLAAARYYETLGDDEIAGVLASHYLAAFRATPAGPEAEALAAQARVALRAAADRAEALHSFVSMLQYLEQALEVTADPAEQVTLHARAADASNASASFAAGARHAEEAEAIARSQEDARGILRARSLLAEIKLSQHGDRAATEILEGALAEARDLPSSRELGHAQVLLAQTLMMGGDLRSIEWADRALAQHRVLDERDLLQVLITRGSALINAGRRTESETILRGSIQVAERLGSVDARLRATNNLQGVVGHDDFRSYGRVIRESYELAERFGLRGWMLHFIGAGLVNADEQGDWDAWQAEAAAERTDAGEFYGVWFETEEARRQVFRGDPDEAEARLVALQSLPAVRESVQVTAGIIAALARAHLAQGRWEDARRMADAARVNSELEIVATLETVLAAAGAGRGEWIAPALDLLSADRTQGTRETLAVQHLGTTLAALLEQRWEEGRAAFRLAQRELDEMGLLTPLARLQLAVGHLAGGRFPEADAAAAAADRFFGERGAAGYVARWREHAWQPPPSGRSARASRGTSAQDATTTATAETPERS